ncbi:MAG: ribonuclease Y [Patescibacteria group bacterium]
MLTKTVLLVAGSVGLLGVCIGYFLRWLISLGQKGSIELSVKQMLLDAKTEAARITEDAERKAADRVARTEEDLRSESEKMKKLEDRLLRKDENLDRRQSDIDREVESLKGKIAEIKELKEKAKTLETERQALLEKTAKLSEKEARDELFSNMERIHAEDLTVRMQKLERDGVERLDRKAKDILSTSIQRLAQSTAGEAMTTSVALPGDEVKGKIIGKEGRNIRAFERAAGVELVIDDTPGVIIISAFDPVRRHIAKVALENLIHDGRIQPAKIEEAVEHAKNEINKIIKEEGERAAYETGVFNLDPRIISILGRLHFRTSYGQNVLQHSTEMAHIAGMLAEELGADVAVARAGALVHDIGKAVDHEVAGTHVDIGRRILQKFGADPRIISAMQSHHEEYPYETIESVIVQTADAISGGRPGARRDSVENYLKRLHDLEAIATSFKGVERSYAIQAGREVRVFVNPLDVSDIEAKKMAREIAVRIEQELKYPGEIKVIVVRENRTIEYAR